MACARDISRSTTSDEALEIDPDVLYRRFLVHAPELATRAAHAALEQRGAAPREIDAVLISTCTGYFCPGLTSYVGERLGLRADVLALDLVGQGCGAALPNLRTADALSLRGACEHVLSVCVEVCSAALYIDNDPGVLVSACLFGDGAAAAVTSNQPRGETRACEWLGGVSLHGPRRATRCAWRAAVACCATSCRAKCRRSPASMRAACSRRVWNEHGFGARHRRLDLARRRPHGARAPARRDSGCEERDMRRSAELLARFGNLSSPFVLFVLDAALRERERPAAGGGCRPSAPASAATARSSKVA